ncbi:MAG TPA: D-alanyl-D-alanine carboxypeptidase [Chitinophagaceae bacterium]|nr:D-alanyl-D-alanine carboxypeptidase [Chitinophagaceae bacterium]
MKTRIVYGFYCLLVFSSCSISKQIAKVAKKELLSDSALLPAHLGICVFEPATGKYLYKQDAEKYFVPASNTKIFSLYAGMKYLGDSLPGLKYYETADSLYLQPTGDPTLLHPDFKEQRIVEFLKSKNKIVAINTSNWKEDALGFGWAWDDYESYYMAERSPLPVYGNVIKWIQATSDSIRHINNISKNKIYSQPQVNWGTTIFMDSINKSFYVKRERSSNEFSIHKGGEKYRETDVPYVTNGILTALELLKDTVKQIAICFQPQAENHQLQTIFSVPSDTLFKLMMHRSDNFFAEQTLLMAANEKLGIMKEEAIINYLLKNELKEIPQKPKWVDGSGLSRYNLFTPQSFVWMLNKMKAEFGLARMENILPTGGTGTLRSLFLKDKGFIYAKTGTLSNHTSLSGYIITKKNRLLIFSLQANHFLTGATPVRIAFERFITNLRNKY